MTNNELHALMMKAEGTQIDTDEVLTLAEYYTFGIYDYAELSEATTREELSFLDDADEIEEAMFERTTYSHVLKTERGIFYVCTRFLAGWVETFHPMLCVGDDEEIDRVLVVCDDKEIRSVDEAADYYDAKWD